MKTTLITLIFLGLQSLATTSNDVTLEMSLSINGAEVSKPMLKIEFGKTGMIESATESGDGIFIEVLPTRVGEKGVMMKFKVGQIVSGKKQLLGQPQIIAQLGEKAEITQSDETGSSLSLVVTPRL